MSHRGVRVKLYLREYPVVQLSLAGCDHGVLLAQDGCVKATKILHAVVFDFNTPRRARSGWLNSDLCPERSPELCFGSPHVRIGVAG